MSSLYFTKEKQSNDDSPTCSSSGSSSRIDSMLSSLAVSHAEIYWVLKVLSSHFSYRSCLDVNGLFRKMFPDSPIVKSFQISKTKCVYYVVYGLAPYFKDLLFQNIKSLSLYSMLFDESLNYHLQEEQMDVQIRFWDDQSGEVETRYLDSRFFKRPNAENILEELLKSIANLPEEKMSMLSMDGPNTNWTVLEKLTDHCDKNEFPKLFDVGLCGLHSIQWFSKLV